MMTNEDTPTTLIKSTLAKLKEEMRLFQIKLRLKAALRRKPRPAKLKETNNE